MSRRQTPSQTIGPFFHAALIDNSECTLVNAETLGTRIRVEGRVFDGDGVGISDAMVEVWQANAAGRYDHAGDEQDKALDPNFKGYGRAATDKNGRFRFDTIKPGAVPGPGNSLQAPHLNITVFARGMLNHVFTRLYFADEAGNTDDPVLSALNSQADRDGLTASVGDRGGQPVYTMDIHLQGEKETVFFD